MFRNQSPRAGPAAAAVNTTDCRFEYWLFSFRIKVVVGRFASGFLFFFICWVLSRGVQMLVLTLSNSPNSEQFS